MKDLFNIVWICIDYLKQAKDLHDLYVWITENSDKIDKMICNLVFRASVALSDG